MTVRVRANILLVRLGLRDALPIEAIRRITVNDCGELLVNLPSQDFFFNTALDLPQFTRKTVVDKLLLVNRQLSRNGLSLFIHEAYRSPEKQMKMRDDELKKLYALYPEKSDNEIESLVGNRIAGSSSSSTGGHQTGGAVDVTLCTGSGDTLDMGTEYLEFSEKSHTKSKIHNADGARNRRILLSAMKNAGFVNFPFEWWHYSYGDAMWAAYSGKKQSIYGPVTIGPVDK